MRYELSNNISQLSRNLAYCIAVVWWRAWIYAAQYGYISILLSKWAISQFSVLTANGYVTALIPIWEYICTGDWCSDAAALQRYQCGRV